MTQGNPTPSRTEVPPWLQALLRHRVLIPTLAVLAGLAAGGLSLTQDEKYAATSSLLFRDPAFDQKLFGGTVFQPADDPTREAATNIRLVSLETVADQAAEALGGRLTGEQVRAKITVSAAGQSDVVNVEATDPDPAFAAQVANVFAEQYIRFRREADQQKIRSAQELVERQIQELRADGASGGRIKDLESQAESLGVLASLQTGNAELVQEARPSSSPVAPKPVRNAVLGGLAGLLLGMLIAITIERFDRRFSRVEELEQELDLPLLATIPASREVAAVRQESWATGVPELEAFRLLRATLRYFNVERKIKTLMITSPASGDGKTTIAWNLAAANAVTGRQRVLLVEADLRRPSLRTLLQLPGVAGLSDVLSHGLHWSEAVQQVELLPPRDGQTGAAFDVLPSGAIPPNPTEMLESSGMLQLLEAWAEVYDVVIVDTPPLPAVPDAIPLVSKVDGVIFVTNIARTRRDVAISMRDQLQRLNAPLLGIVVNGTSSRDDRNYGYGYSYGYGTGGSAETSQKPMRQPTP